MTQLTFLFPRRFELKAEYWSWREGDRIVRVYRGPRSFDESWPWWTPSEPA